MKISLLFFLLLTNVYAKQPCDNALKESYLHYMGLIGPGMKLEEIKSFYLNKVKDLTTSDRLLEDTRMILRSCGMNIETLKQFEEKPLLERRVLFKEAEKELKKTCYSKTNKFLNKMEKARYVHQTFKPVIEVAHKFESLTAARDKIKNTLLEYNKYINDSDIRKQLNNCGEDDITDHLFFITFPYIRAQETRKCDSDLMKGLISSFCDLDSGYESDSCEGYNCQTEQEKENYIMKSSTLIKKNLKTLCNKDLEQAARHLYKNSEDFRFWDIKENKLSCSPHLINEDAY